MLGKILPMDKVTYATLVERLRIDGLKGLVRQADAIAMVNWTMTMGMTEIWRRLAAEVFPGLRQDRPLIFVDLADPAKRTVADLRAAFDALKELQRYADVLLGMNGAELRQVLTALAIDVPAAEPEWEA